MAEQPRGWHPDIFGKQVDLYNTRKSIVLADGSRASGKTIGVCHKVIRHMTETPGADVGAFATTIKAAKDCGSWQLLHQVIVPEWLSANLRTQRNQSIQYLSKSWEGDPGPKRDSITRTEYFEWRNVHDGKSKCSLFSIDNIDDIAAIVKQKQFSMVWMIELSTFKSKKVLQYTLPCLRMKHLVQFDGTPQNYHQWIADTNPDEELGAQSWVYQFFYKDRNNPPQDQPGDSDEVKEEKQQEREWLADTEVVWMHWSENPHASKKLIANIRFGCQGDQALIDSHVNGAWGEGGVKKEKHFANVFIKSKHVIGGGEDEEDQIAVSKNTETLYCGWDLGASINHAATILEKRLPLIGGVEGVQWNVLDELVHIGEDIDLYEFTDNFMAKMEAIEKVSGKKFNWVHWSDDTALNVFRSAANTYDYLVVLAASEARLHKRFTDKEITAEQVDQMRIKLQGVNKPSGSVRTRVRIIRQLLQEGRIFISSRCVHTIAMLENLKKTVKEYIDHDHHVHPFDSLSYPIFKECEGQLQEDAYRPQAVAKQAEEEESGVISV